MYDKMPPGLYDLIQTEALKTGITNASLTEFCLWRELDREQTFSRLVQHMARVLSASLTESLNEKKPGEWQKSIENWLKRLPEEEKLIATLLPASARSLQESNSLSFAQLDVFSGGLHPPLNGFGHPDL